MAKGCCNRNPIFVQNILRNSAAAFPNPPYAVFSSNGFNVLTSITGLTYIEGNGPSPNSPSFELIGDELSPANDNITITPDSNFSLYFEVYNPAASAYTDAAFNIAYTGGHKNLPGFEVRLKSGLSFANYTGTLTVTAPNTTPFVLTATGVVTAASYIVATGGTEVVDGDYKVHTFTGDGTFEVTQLGSAGNDNVEYLVVAGAGGGGGAASSAAGGAGGGGYRTNTGLVVAVQSYAITVGGGGAGVSINGLINGSNGSDSIFSSITSTGGGGGGGSNTLQAGSGGSGGGATNARPNDPGDGTAGQGNDGGVAGSRSGGGGGAGAVGTNSGNAFDGGNGGNGLQSSISGAATYYAGGGGGGAFNNGVTGSPGQGGLGGGGDGAVGDGGGTILIAAQNGTANSGGGGGGAFFDSGSGNPSGNGGSGIVIIRYKFQ